MSVKDFMLINSEEGTLCLQKRTRHPNQARLLSGLLHGEKGGAICPHLCNIKLS